MVAGSEFPALFPQNLLELETVSESERDWRAIHTKPRQEKALARDLWGYEIPYYLPLVPQTKVYRRRRVTSLLPLFPSYVFVCCTDVERVNCLTTNRVTQFLEVSDQERLRLDLNQFRHLIESGAPLTIESRLVPGNRVRIKHGPLAGMEGEIVSRRGERRLFIAVDFLQRGASIAVDDFMVEITS